MRIKLDNGWFIEDEVYGYTCYQEVLNEKGKIVQKNTTFPTTIERCVEIIIRTNLSDKIKDDITFVDYIKAMRIEFNTLMQDINKHIKEETE